jgi:hypothetical protein
MISVMLSSTFRPSSEGDCVISEERSTPTSVDCKVINTELFADVDRSTPTSVDCEAINTDLFADVPPVVVGVGVGL